MTEGLQIQGLVYKKNWHTILQDVNLSVAPGKIVGLLGENGAGKTTLMRLIAGMAKSNHGQISINGTTTPAAKKQAVSFSAALNGFPKNTPIKKIVTFYQTVYPDFTVKKYQELATFLKINGQQKLNELSKGMREKLVIALTLARQTQLYLLDEPFSGIDSMSRKGIIQSIIQWKDPAAIMLISDHYVAEIAAILDDVVIIKNQTIYTHQDADTIRAEHGQSIEAYYESVYQEQEVTDHDVK